MAKSMLLQYLNESHKLPQLQTDGGNGYHYHPGIYSISFLIFKVIFSTMGMT